MENLKLNTLVLMVVALVVALAACAPAPTLQSVKALTATQTPTIAPPTSTRVPTRVSPTPTRVSTPTPEFALDADALKNLVYRSEWTASGTAPLTDGAYSEAAAPGSATKTEIRLHDLMAFGKTTDGQSLAVAILVTNPGGSGTFFDLAAVTIHGGEPVHVGTARLGDRAQIESLAIENGEVIVEMVTQGPDDPMCCPTQRVVARYALQDELVQVSSEILSDTPELAGTVWEWERFLGGDGSAIEVQDPTRYTLILNPDGTYQVRADCNRLGGGYTLDKGSLVLHPGPMTLAECGPDSLYDEFIAYLGDVRTYVMDGEKLVLDLWADAGQMVFRPVQAVQLPEVESDLVGITWEWVRFLGGDDSRIDVDNPSRYTLTLNPDGTYQIKADCNTSVGAYTWDAAHLELKPGPTTLAECAPGSLYSDFLVKLGHVRTYVFDDDGKLVLDLWADAGQMIFRQAGSAGILAEGNNIDLDVHDITLDTQDLPYVWQPVYVPAAPYDASTPPGPKGLPAHIEILFGVTDPKDRQPGDPAMFIIPVDAYEELWQKAGNESVASAMDNVYRMALLLPYPSRTAGMPVLPFEAFQGVNDLAVQVSRISATAERGIQDGYRFVGRWAQDANPVSNAGLRYVYMGFTSDAKYLVAFTYPVSTSTLPSVEEVSADEQKQVTNDYQTHMQERVEMLNGLGASDWEPNLDVLDALVASLNIKDTPISAVPGKTWQWEHTLDVYGGDETAIDNPEVYTLVYGADGTFHFTADCNKGSGTYTIAPGIAGSLKTELGPMTLAACGPDSRSQDLVNALVAAQDFKVGAGGNEFRLVLPAGGGELVFRNASQPEAMPSLEGTLWQLIAYADDRGNLTDMLPGTEITAELLDGQLAGSAGCNRYMAPYTLSVVEGDAITFGLAASTRMMCASPDGIMEQEQGYLAVLESVDAYRISGDKLDLVDANGATLATFVASADQSAE